MALARGGLLRANAATTLALDALRQQARTLEIRLDSVRKITIPPTCDIPYPLVDLTARDDPISTILNNWQFLQTDQYFARNPGKARSLISVKAQALLFTVVRNLRPDHVIEIGVYKAATTEAIARALYANGSGLVHAVDPFRTEYISAMLKQWPPELISHVTFHPTNSVEFFAVTKKRNIRPALVLVDGNHDYEFAHFDIFSAARNLLPGGFIFVDNIAQPGPFLAAEDFLKHCPGWTVCGEAEQSLDMQKPYDRQRGKIPGTELMVLRAPRYQHIWHRPWSPGQVRRSSKRVEGVRLKLRPEQAGGRLSVQIVLRGFGPQPIEHFAGATLDLPSHCERATVALDQPIQADGDFTHLTVEPWLVWDSDAPLLLSDPIEVI